MADIDKEREFFRLTGYANSDLYIRYRRLSEFQSALSIANKNFTEQVATNILNQDTATQLTYLDRLEKKFQQIDISNYANLQTVLSFLRKHQFEWTELNAFYRTMRDFYLLEIDENRVIGYHNKEPDIPTDYDAPEMAFLKKGIGFMTDEDARKSREYEEKYGRYTRDFWDIFHKDILSQQRFLELLPRIYQIASEVPTFFEAAVAGAPHETLLQLQFYVFNGMQRECLLSAKSFIKETQRSIMKEQNRPQFDNFNVFVKSFEYNYPYKEAVMFAVDRWKTNLSYLQKEILENLMILDATGRKVYLKRLKLDCEQLMQNAHTPFEELKDCLEQYNTSLWETVDPHPFITTDLNDILASEPETFEQSFEPGLNPSASIIRHNFYNYFYGYYLGEALTYIDEQGDPTEIKTDSLIASTKLKTKLTVPQLAYLFKLLMNEDSFDYKHKTEVYRFIAAVFETGKTNTISADSIKNNMDNVDIKSIDAIQGKVMRILQSIKSDKENFGK